MNIIVKQGRFEKAKEINFLELESGVATAQNVSALGIESDLDPALLETIPNTVGLISIKFPTSADGRGFSLARALRDRGFKGHLRASGHVLADQYPLAIRSGFDDVEISEELAARQPQEQWAESLTRINETYQNRLQGLSNPATAAA